MAHSLSTSTFREDPPQYRDTHYYIPIRKHGHGILFETVSNEIQSYDFHVHSWATNYKWIDMHFLDYCLHKNRI